MKISELRTHENPPRLDFDHTGTGVRCYTFEEATDALKSKGRFQQFLCAIDIFGVIRNGIFLTSCAMITEDDTIYYIPQNSLKRYNPLYDRTTNDNEASLYTYSARIKRIIELKLK